MPLLVFFFPFRFNNNHQANINLTSLLVCLITAVKSSWRQVTSLNDVDHGTESTISKSANDTKLVGLTDMPQGRAAFQRDLNRLQKWADKNFMRFNKGKGKLLHLGRNNKYVLGATQLENNLAEKDLGVLVDNKLTRAGSVPLPQRRPTVSCAALGGVLPAGQTW